MTAIHVPYNAWFTSGQFCLWPIHSFSLHNNFTWSPNHRPLLSINATTAKSEARRDRADESISTRGLRPLYDTTPKQSTTPRFKLMGVDFNKERNPQYPRKSFESYWGQGVSWFSAKRIFRHHYEKPNTLAKVLFKLVTNCLTDLQPKKHTHTQLFHGERGSAHYKPFTIILISV